MLPVTNDDDNVWHFTKGRAWSTAKQYFGCYDDSKWQGLPLMGLPDLGRASHWETRVMRDDVMSCAARDSDFGAVLRRNYWAQFEAQFAAQFS